MSAPRQILPGQTYLLTRRCTQRQFLLRPSSTTNQIFLFCLAYAAERTGVEIHAFCVLSNHVHIVLTDPRGELPRFAHWLHLYVAKAMNDSLGRREAFWSSDKYSAVRLIEPADVLEKMVYTLTNPVQAGLVRHGRQWPGAHSRPADIGAAAIVVDRPAFFDSAGEIPETAELRLIRPDGFDDLSNEDFVRSLEERVEASENEIQDRFKIEKRDFLGPERVKRQPTTNTPSTPAKNDLNPRVACRDKGRRIEALERLKEFLAGYRDALLRHVAGERPVVFPAGTYWMRVFHRVNCHPAPA